MTHDHLYYPNLTPRITAKLGISLLHWDRVVRIFPQEGSSLFRPSTGIIRDLESEGLIVNEQLEYDDIQKATILFDRIVRLAEGERSLSQAVAQSLIEPIPKLWKKVDYCIYRGKANYSLSNAYPKYFQDGEDIYGNDLFYCSKETGLTYMTLLTFFLNERKAYTYSYTDQTETFSLFIALNRLFKLREVQSADNLIRFVKSAKQIERIFFLPFYRVLKPRIFRGESSIEKIISFRKDTNNDQIRKEYLSHIDSFLLELNGCQNDVEVEVVAHKHKQAFQNQIKILIAACENNGIPVSKKFISHGSMSAWITLSHLWDVGSSIISIFKGDSLAIIKPLLKVKPSVDFYNEILMKTGYFYPLLIQENFAPSICQEVFRCIRRCNKILIG